MRHPTNEGTPDIEGLELPWWRRRRVQLLVVVLILVSVVVLRHITLGEFNYNVDETQHAVTGLYFADLFVDRPWTHPLEYTYCYYAHYPALSGLIHWPPLFYVVEGSAFLALGRSPVSARLAVLFFALFGLCFWFRIVEDLQDEWTAALSAALLGFLPSVLLFEKTVMLEIPCLALCFAAIYYWMYFLRHGSARALYSCALFSGLALLTKQNAIYLFSFFLLTVLAERKWRSLLQWPSVRALGIGLLLTGPFYLTVYLVHWSSIKGDLTEHAGRGLLNYAFYWLTLPKELGWPLLALSALGIVTCRLWDKRRTLLPMILWIVACYVAFTPIGHKEARYALYWLPPFVYLAVAPLGAALRVARYRLLPLAIVLALLVTYGWKAWQYERPYVVGYQAMARQATSLTGSGFILFDGELAGNFIFYTRLFDPGRRFFVLRKALYAERIKEQLGSVELIHTREELESLLSEYGIRTIVITQGSPILFDVQKTLRDLLDTPQFKLITTIPVQSKQRDLRELSLLLYENNQAAPPRVKSLRIKMLTLHHDIVVPLADAGCR